MTINQFRRMMAAKEKAEKEAEARRKAEAEAKAKAEAEAKEKVRQENHDFEIDLMNGDLKKYGFVSNGSNIVPGYVRGNIEIYYYGGDLAVVNIDGKSIEEIIDIPEGEGPDHELSYRITDEAITYLRRLIVK